MLTAQAVKQGKLIKKPDNTTRDDNKRKRDGTNDNSGEISNKAPRGNLKRNDGNRKEEERYPKCNICTKHHLGVCRRIKCERCHKTGHEAKNCTVFIPTGRVGRNRGKGSHNTCFKCGETGHHRKDCPGRINGRGNNTNNRNRK